MNRLKNIKYKVLIVDIKKKLSNTVPSIGDSNMDIDYVNDIEDVFQNLTLYSYHLIVIVQVHNIENMYEIIKTICILKKSSILILIAEIERIIHVGSGIDVVLLANYGKVDIKQKISVLMQQYLEGEINIEKQKTIVQEGAFVMNLLMRKTFWKDHELKFTKREFDFMYLLAASPERVYSFSQIYQTVWGDYPSGNIANMIWCMIRRIKKKMKVVDPNIPNMIHNVRNIGYYFKINTDI